MSAEALLPAREAGGIDPGDSAADRLGYDPDDMLRTAWLSEDGVYRWTLYRRLRPGQLLTFIMLNPSTADATTDDPTIVKCLGFAARLGFSGIAVVNLYPYRATKPTDLWAAWKRGVDITGGWKGNCILKDTLRDAVAFDRPVIAACGTPTPTEAARRRHAQECPRQGWPGTNPQFPREQAEEP
jgi:hypothetical protein